MTAPAPRPRKGEDARVVVYLLGVVVLMGALSWAAVPFYNWFCRVTGFAGTTNVATSLSDTILDQDVRVRFDANVMPGMGWTFRPVQKEMTLKIGQDALAYYEAINTTDQPITGRASYNVAPDSAGYFFDKIECFCFTEQTLQPGERVLMPVNFYVDPDIVNDRDARGVRDITLSYTFYRADKAANQTSADASDVLDAPAKTTVN